MTVPWNGGSPMSMMATIYMCLPLSISLLLLLGPASEVFVRDLVFGDSSRSHFPSLTYSDNRPFLSVLQSFL